MTLDIIVPHYKESWSKCKYLFDTISTQRGIAMKDIGVIVVNDGDVGGCNLTLADTEAMQKYPYSVQFVPIVHSGVSAARNYGLDYSNADYVMFCDIDDGFLSNYALHMIFNAMREGFDFLTGAFIEESLDTQGNPTLVRHERDMSFMHGKVYRREFLVEHDIRFDPTMTLHEDGYFNALAYLVAEKEGTAKRIDTPFYIWRWSDDSTVRRDRQDFVLRTYTDVMKVRDGICEQYKARGYDEEYKVAVCTTFLNSYYDFQKPSYHLPRNAAYLQKAERAFKRYYDKYSKVFYDCTNLEIAEMARSARELAISNGMLMERQTLREFLNHIKEVR